MSLISTYIIALGNIMNERIKTIVNSPCLQQHARSKYQFQKLHQQHPAAIHDP